MATYNGINHLALVTGDMDRTVRFWRDLLGLRLVASLGHRGYRHYFFELSEHDMIAFFEWPGVEPVEEGDHGAPRRGPLGFDHVSLGVEEKGDLWDLKDRLDAAAIWTSEVVDHGFILSLYTFDPNNIPLEFSFTVSERDPRENPVLSDSEPGEVAREGSEPQAGKWPAVSRPTAVSERRTYPGAGSELFHGTGS